MGKMINFVAGSVTVLGLSAVAFGGSLSEQYTSCVAKHADPKVGASVMLECVAAEGKLTNCKVLEAPTPSNGFDKAAICVAEVIPVGTKTGAIKVPLKFNPS